MSEQRAESILIVLAEITPDDRIRVINQLVNI